MFLAMTSMSLPDGRRTYMPVSGPPDGVPLAAGLRQAMATVLSGADQAFVTAEAAEDTLAAFGEGLRGGVDGWVDDNLATVKPWGFDLDTISVSSFVRQGRPRRVIASGT